MHSLAGAVHELMTDPQLIEHLDNANNMAVLKLWEPLLMLLSSPHETIVAHTCWIMGTAVQNNLKAQAAVSALEDVCDPPHGVEICSHQLTVLSSIHITFFPRSSMSSPPPALTPLPHAPEQPMLFPPLSNTGL